MADVTDLDGCRLKLARADYHLKALDGEVEWFLKRHPQRFVVERHPETGEDLLWTVYTGNPPDEWSCIVGDVLFNLRSGLDHLAHQLVLLAGNEPTTQNAFPVFESDPFAAGAKRDDIRLWEKRTEGMDPADIATLKKLQPYTRGDKAAEHPLFLLHGLNNWDKHSELHLSARQFQYGGFELDFSRVKSRADVEVTPFAPLDARAAGLPIARVKGQMKMKIHAPFDISFREGPWEFLRVRETLTQIATFAEDVVNEFEPRFRESG